MNSHLVNKLSKKSRIKNRKQQLCDRINQCKWMMDSFLI